MSRRRRSEPADVLYREAAIAAVAPVVQPSCTDSTSEPLVELELRGTLDEPIREVRAVVFRLSRTRERRFSFIDRVRPYVDVVAHLPPESFDYVWSLALSGHLRYASIHFAKPHRGRASVQGLSFYKEQEGTEPSQADPAP